MECVGGGQRSCQVDGIGHCHAPTQRPKLQACRLLLLIIYFDQFSHIQIAVPIPFLPASVRPQFPPLPVWGWSPVHPVLNQHLVNRALGWDSRLAAWPLPTLRGPGFPTLEPRTGHVHMGAVPGQIHFSIS
jgi:hypothetical protein